MTIRNLIILLCFFLFSLTIHSQQPNKQLVDRLDGIAKSQHLELVKEENFPIINPYGSAGTPFVFNFMDQYHTLKIKNSSLFLCRKPNKYYKKKDSLSITDLVNYFDYCLVFAIQKETDNRLEFVEILDTAIGLKGLYKYYGSAFNDLSKFHFLNGKKMDPKLIDWHKLSLPIIISGISSTTVLRNYDGDWIQFEEIEQ